MLSALMSAAALTIMLLLMGTKDGVVDIGMGLLQLHEHALLITNSFILFFKNHGVFCFF